MPYMFGDRRVSGIAELLDFMKNDHEMLRERTVHKRSDQVAIWYRGLPSAELSLLPTLHREGIPVELEDQLMNRFLQNAHEFLDVRPQGEWEWMLLARHHGLPSRLLDWTENPLAGLFFAAGDESDGYTQTDGALWCLSPRDLNELGNVSTPTHVLPMFRDEIEIPTSDEVLNNYRTSSVRSATLEQPRPPAAAISIRTNKRIQAQLGVFTIHHSDTKPLEKWEDGSFLWRYIVPKGAKALLRDELRLAGVSSLTLFPDLDNVAREAKRGY